MQIINYSPGQKTTFFLETVDGYGERADGYALPVVTRIIFPDLSLASGFPQNMTKLDTGLYYYQFTLPIGATAVGSYFVDVSFTNLINGMTNHAGYQIVVNAPYGNYGTSIK